MLDFEVSEFSPGNGGRPEARGSVVLRRFEVEPLVPLHHQVRVDLSLQLRSRRWRAGAALPSEVELCRHYGVSRGTIRQALHELAREGLIERHPGRGSFVRQPKHEGSIAGSYQRFRIDGPPLDPGGKVLGFDCRVPTSEVADILSLGPGQRVFQIERVRFVRGSAVAIQSSCLPEALFAGLSREELETRHLIDVIRERHGIEFTRADEYIEPAVADDYIARHLTVEAGTPVFQLERRTYLPNFRVGEFRRAVMRGDTYRYKIELR